MEKASAPPMASQMNQLNPVDPDNIQPRIIRDKTTDQIKLEDTLVDYMEIIITLNAKVNNHVHSTKMSMRELD